ncbi:hypothetical protein TNCV_2654821 [Trichonephila clavipes]|nr:hypothetical protein TNCV_2654821 [Trichonephila clavipes]
MNETTQQEKTTQLSSRNEQLNSAAGTKQLNSPLHCRQPPTTACNRLHPPALPLQQNRLFLPTQEQLRKDAEYYHNVLKRVILAVKYLAIRGLSIRGVPRKFLILLIVVMLWVPWNC